MIYRLLILCVVFVGCQTSTTKSSDEKEIKVSYNLEPYQENYPNGLKKIEGKLLNEERHGNWIAYYENGMKWSEGRFKFGVRQGTARVYYENGKKKIEGEYKDGLKIGVWTVWDEDGTIAGRINLNESLSHSDSLKLEMIK